MDDIDNVGVGEELQERIVPACTVFYDVQGMFEAAAAHGRMVIPGPTGLWVPRPNKWFGDDDPFRFVMSHRPAGGDDSTVRGGSLFWDGEAWRFEGANGTTIEEFSAAMILGLVTEVKARAPMDTTTPQPTPGAHRLINGEICRQDVPGGRWTPLTKAEANALLDRLTSAPTADRDYDDIDDPGKTGLASLMASPAGETITDAMVERALDTKVGTHTTVQDHLHFNVGDAREFGVLAGDENFHALDIIREDQMRDAAAVVMRRILASLTREG